MDLKNLQDAGLQSYPMYWQSLISSKTSQIIFLFTLTQGKSFVYMLVYIYDLIIGSNDSALISNFKFYLSRWFHIKNLGVLKYFLRIDVLRGKECIYLSQRKYALVIIEECSLLGLKPVDTPIEQNHNFSKDEDNFSKNRSSTDT